MSFLFCVIILTVLSLSILCVALGFFFLTKKDQGRSWSILNSPTKTQSPPGRKEENSLKDKNDLSVTKFSSTNRPEIPAVQDFALWVRHLNNAKNYFEFGSGKSTMYASSLPHLERITAVENEKSWFEKVSKTTSGDARVRVIYVDTNSDGSPFGYPKVEDPEKATRYFTSYDPEMEADLILIDGRFRVACCLDLYPKIGTETLVYFDDFFSRPHYHDVLYYFDVWEKGNDSAVLKKKPESDNAMYHSLVDRYKTDPR